MASVAKFPSITRENVHEWIRYDGLENFTAAQAKGRGVLVATAHLGNWELSAFTHALMTAPMHIVVRPLDNPRVDAWVEQRRALSGNHIIHKKEAAREILRALAAGDAVGILIDQNTTPAEGVFIDFFGRKACAGTAFVKFAHHTGAAVVPGYALWSEQEKKYILRFDPRDRDDRRCASRHAARACCAGRRDSASIPISGCGFTGAGRRGRRAKLRCISACGSYSCRSCSCRSYSGRTSAGAPERARPPKTAASSRRRPRDPAGRARDRRSRYCRRLRSPMILRMFS